MATPTPVTKYARNGELHLAYQVLGEGPPDLLVVPSGPGSHIDHQWEEPSAARSLRRLASFSRLIIYDNRGVGLSDPVTTGQVPTTNDEVDDIRAVLDAAGSERAVLMGMYAGGAASIVFAATYPERVQGLVLMSSYARLRKAADYPIGVDDAVVEQVAHLVLGSWGTGASLDVVNPSVAGSASFRRWYAQMERLAASPGAAAAMARQWFDVDVRDVLPTVHTPALVVAHDEQPLFGVEHTRYLAAHLPDSRYLELPGRNLHFFVDEAEMAAAIGAVEEFVTGMPHVPDPDRFLGTVLFVDMSSSTELAGRLGDRRFRELLAEFHQMFGRQLERYHGRLVDTAGDGALALFDSPARAIACALAMRDAVRALDVQIHAGLHTGEMEREHGGDVRGIAVHIGARVLALAGAGEILVSRTIRDLIAGSSVRLESRGVHELKGVPEPWEVFAVQGRADQTIT
ncbi:MAG: adenylate/guanylate cyclase domain-containing protein [Candidatus Dormibacteraeota bacterium]|nr:adenylate/guanylate cyclase domain-containing protein [Candidatus Dormibacteraeota bacterium]MBV9525358.1 adenylate/guanylate cyclase domain-containing protein [Candidatus Dormibacteraeota bacterium]